MLLSLQHYDGDVKELCLDFTVTEESIGKRHIIELKPGGKDVCVTNESKLQYVHAMADYKLNRQVRDCLCCETVCLICFYWSIYRDFSCELQILPLSNAFYRGLTDLIAPSWLKLFNASEFNQVFPCYVHCIIAIRVSGDTLLWLVLR